MKKIPLFRYFSCPHINLLENSSPISGLKSAVAGLLPGFAWHFLRFFVKILCSASQTPSLGVSRLGFERSVDSNAGDNGFAREE